MLQKINTFIYEYLVHSSKSVGLYHRKAKELLQILKTGGTKGARGQSPFKILVE